MTAPIADGIRPSAMPRIMDCKGSVKAMASMPPQTDNEHTDLGKKRHAGMALMLRLGPVRGATKLAQEQDWDAEDIQVTGTAYNLAADILANYPELVVEHEVDVSFLGITGGERRIDVAGYNPTTETALVLDWKFGVGAVDDPETNWQELTYAPGWVAELVKAGKVVRAVELVIIQPRAYRKDDQSRSHTMPIDQVRANGLKVLDAVKLARTDNAPRTPTDRACQYCTFKEACPERLGVEKQKAAKVKADRQELVAAGTPIMVLPDAKFPLSLPLVVVSQEVIDKVEALCTRALAIKVVDLATAEEAGRLSKELRKWNRDIDENRKEVAAPLVFYKKQLDDAPRALTKKITDTDNYIQSEGQRYLAEQVELARKAEAARQALEDAQRLAEEERQRAERARKPENKAAADQAALAAENQLKELQLQAMATPQGPAPVLQFTGFKAAPTVSLTIHDVGLVPQLWARQLLVVDEKKVAKLLLAGQLKEEDVKGWGTITRGTAAGRK